MTEADRTREDEWFLRNERELLEAARKKREGREREREAAERVEERERLRSLHFMKCPKCGHDLQEQPVGGVVIDRCVFCEGVFLDAGELEKLFSQREDDRKGFLRRVIGI